MKGSCFPKIILWSFYALATQLNTNQAFAQSKSNLTLVSLRNQWMTNFFKLQTAAFTPFILSYFESHRHKYKSWRISRNLNPCWTVHVGDASLGIASHRRLLSHSGSHRSEQCHNFIYFNSQSRTICHGVKCRACN